MPTKPSYPFVRPLHVGVEKGTDIQAVKRALSRTGYLPWRSFDNAYYKNTATAVSAFQHDHGIEATGRYGEPTHLALVATKATAEHPGERAFDEYAGELLWAEHERRLEDPGLRKVRELLAVCQSFKGTYLYGGGHGVLLSKLSRQAPMDCSASTCKALFDVDLYQDDYATNSVGLESYGKPDHGRWLTIHANWEHVWMEFTLPEGWYRFDTSPHGCGSRGPRVRTCRRFSTTFVARHPDGL